VARLCLYSQVLNNKKPQVNPYKVRFIPYVKAGEKDAPVINL
jgi:hypothetical protein